MVAFPKEYIDSIPDIYKEILASFPKIQPNRSIGDKLAVYTLQVKLEEQGKPYSVAEIKSACNSMARHGVVKMTHDIFVAPTETGERLIQDLSGTPARTPSVPEFPAPPLTMAVSSGS